MRWLPLLLGAGLMLGCRTGPDPACVMYCERQNDACMMSATDPRALQRCDEGMGQCLAACR